MFILNDSEKLGLKNTVLIECDDSSDLINQTLALALHFH